MAQSPSSTRRRMSETEFLSRLHEKPYLEYLDGEVVEKPVPGRKHWELGDEIAAALRAHRTIHGGKSGGEAHVRFPGAPGVFFRVLDLAYWAPGKPLGDTDIALPPTLAVEVRSPGQSLRELRQTCAFMAANGVDACWLIDPDRQLAEVFEGDGRRIETVVLDTGAAPGLRLVLDDLFAVIEA